MKPTVKSQQSKIDSLETQLRRSEAWSDEYKTTRDKYSGEIDGLRREVESLERRERELFTQLLDTRSAVLEYFLAISNPATKDNADYILTLHSRISGMCQFQPNPPQKSSSPFPGFNNY